MSDDGHEWVRDLRLHLRTVLADLERGAGRTRTDDLTDYESAALTAELPPPNQH